VHKELVIGGSGSFRITPIGLRVIGKPGIDEWISYGEVIKKIENATPWVIGDWLLYGEKWYGEEYTQAIDSTGKDYKTIRTYQDTCRAFGDSTRRRVNVPFSLHSELAWCNEDEQDKWLDICESEGLKRDELRKRIKDVKLLAKAELGKQIRLDIDFRRGDFREVFRDIADGSVDLILTDPPYPKEYLDLWDGLSAFAARVLKPGAFCIAYSGQANLPEVIRRLGTSLEYYWTFCLYHEGSTQIVNGINVMCRWKPILLYQKAPKRKIDNTVQDYLVSSGKQEKGDHEWQQTESGVGRLIELFSEPGDIILDPFAGSGTALKCAHDAGRKPIGCELDEKSYNVAKLRIAS